MVRVTIIHMRQAGYCLSGVRRFYTDHGLDFRELIEEGTPANRLVATGDGMALAVVALAEAESNGTSPQNSSCRAPI